VDALISPLVPQNESGSLIQFEQIHQVTKNIKDYLHQLEDDWKVSFINPIIVPGILTDQRFIAYILQGCLPRHEYFTCMGNLVEYIAVKLELYVQNQRETPKVEVAPLSFLLKQCISIMDEIFSDPKDSGMLIEKYCSKVQRIRKISNIVALNQETLFAPEMERLLNK
jgi:hypothetical protein